jgi:hypothetical protein
MRSPIKTANDCEFLAGIMNLFWDSDVIVTQKRVINNIVTEKRYRNVT